MAVAAGLTALVACGSGGGGKSTDPKTVTLVSHDSFNASKSVLEEFTKQTGYKVNVLKGGDAGKAVNQAILSKDNPQGDVFFGIDNTLLSRGLKAGIFSPYQAKGLERVPEELQLDKAEHRVTPVDYGDTCVNYDRAYFAEHKIAPPRTFDDLLKPEYKGLLVTENSATSSPGLAFQLGTIAKYGESGWQDYWKKLKANGVEVVDGWEQAYNERFSGSAAGKGKGDKPLVVSYASSPPVEVLGKKPEPKEAPTGVATGTCFRQTEFAGLLKGAGNEKGGKALLDFLLSKKFQEDVPLQMFVNPARTDAKVPELFTKYGEKIDKPGTVAPEAITENREKWIKQWSSLVLK
ncbi:ABC transporter substrate-binding protein [Streptomyces rimosus subsp. rimosus]|nr:ABC transporter substrate-binding protein [Streptomyces sp. NRRL WC-3701]KOT38977.1 ABC transporter substrate-binding protein [Streptomyces rimosus subsp. rimosus]KOT62731.1 ABC transporter substrate-binding protein [Streptomyces rimosus subsp. rimosus]KOT71333.1 ABC transporter substrate-binding protein [Streptomyces rimosus subsp. rimosus]KOT78529.1 ABC transporter substrate-binding protein [Streptomyces rimosus subsp. rimosus]